MREISQDIHTWSVFNEEKQLDFNGLYLRLDGQAVLIDPPPLSQDEVAEIARLGKPDLIILTNKDHRRAAPELRDQFGAQIVVHENDQPLLDCPVEGSYRDGDLLAGALTVMLMSDAKSPGECALYWKARRILILGDALIGKPAGALSLLPDAKFADPAKARVSMKHLAKLEVDQVLVGDGAHILEGARQALDAFAQS